MRGTQIKLGAAVKAARKKMKLTQMELAEVLGISLRYLQTIENEQQTPSYIILERIFERMDIPASSIFGPEEGDTTQDKERLIYLINHKCTSSDISVLLSTAEALTSKLD